MAFVAGLKMCVCVLIIINLLFKSCFSGKISFHKKVTFVNIVERTELDNGLIMFIVDVSHGPIIGKLCLKFSVIDEHSSLPCCENPSSNNTLGAIIAESPDRTSVTFKVMLPSKLYKKSAKCCVCTQIGNSPWMLRRTIIFAETVDKRTKRSYNDIRGINSYGSVVNMDREVDKVKLKIDGFRVEASDHNPSYGDGGVPELLADVHSTIRIFGKGITKNTVIIFTQEPREYGGPCLLPATGLFQIDNGSVTTHTALVHTNLPRGPKPIYYICAKKIETADGRIATYEEALADSTAFIHQGTHIWLQIRTYQKLIPLWACLVIITVCISFSSLFSGLNIGLMSMDRTDLKIMCNTGTEDERRYARIILPVREKGNFLLCSILIGNVLVNSTFTILLDDLTSGLVAIILSTLAIVVLGEITPQAICSRHGMAVGAHTINITKAVMVLTCPLSYPISKVLDLILGEEVGHVYDRERLKELVKLTTDVNDLDKDEVNIISGALELRRKKVVEAMTSIEDVFMLDYDSILDFETVSEIMKSGFSRIPVYSGSKDNIVSVLYIKDLAFVDPDDNTPLKTVCEYSNSPCSFVFEDVTLDVLFKQFKEGHKGHMAFVHRVNNEGDGDPFYETIGLITMEDVIEELIQAEIMDETDVYTDNCSKRRRKHGREFKLDFKVFAEKGDNQRIPISPHLMLATFQFLSTTVDAFKPNLISESILHRLFKQDVIHQIKIKSKDKSILASQTIYQRSKPVDYFVLILEGLVEVTVGQENLLFESGPMAYFGVQALTNSMGGESPTPLGSLQSLNRDTALCHTFVPDYTVRAITDVIYISIKRDLYLAARRATLMESSKKDSGEAGDHFEDEAEKLLHFLDEDEPTVMSTLLGTDSEKTQPVSNGKHNRNYK